MENQNSAKSNLLRLPPGFRFHPTDEELVNQYLRRKVLGFPVPESIIPETEICKSDPWDIPGAGDLDCERYFFSKREVKYPNGNRSNRAAGSGYWKATGIDKRIFGSRGSKLVVVGMKKTLVFYRGKPPTGARTDWILHEYRYIDASLRNTMDASRKDWVLCRIFMKKRNKKKQSEKAKENERNENFSPIFYNFLRKDKTYDLNLLPSSSSSLSEGSSGVTETASTDFHEETTCTKES